MIIHRIDGHEIMAMQTWYVGSVKRLTSQCTDGWLPVNEEKYRYMRRQVEEGNYGYPCSVNDVLSVLNQKHTRFVRSITYAGTQGYRAGNLVQVLQNTEAPHPDIPSKLIHIVAPSEGSLRIYCVPFKLSLPERPSKYVSHEPVIVERTG